MILGAEPVVLVWDPSRIRQNRTVLGQGPKGQKLAKSCEKNLDGRGQSLGEAAGYLGPYLEREAFNCVDKERSWELLTAFAQS